MLWGPAWGNQLTPGMLRGVAKRDSWEDLNLCLGLPRGLSSKESAAVQVAPEAWVRSLGGEDPLEEEMATLSNILA